VVDSTTDTIKRGEEEQKKKGQRQNFTNGDKQTGPTFLLKETEVSVGVQEGVVVGTNDTHGEERQQEQVSQIDGGNMWRSTARNGVLNAGQPES